MRLMYKAHPANGVYHFVCGAHRGTAELSTYDGIWRVVMKNGRTVYRAGSRKRAVELALVSVDTGHHV